MKTKLSDIPHRQNGWGNRPKASDWRNVNRANNDAVEILRRIIQLEKAQNGENVNSGNPPFEIPIDKYTIPSPYTTYPQDNVVSAPIRNWSTFVHKENENRELDNKNNYAQDSAKVINSSMNFLLQEGIENTFNSNGYNKNEDRWYPQESVEGGVKTIGRGLKLNNHNAKYYKQYKEQGYLTNEQMEEGMLESVIIHYGNAQRIFDNRFGEGSFQKLDPELQSILVDYAYNGVLGEFKKFMDGIYNNDTVQIFKEYKRYSGNKPLTERNLATYKRLNNYYNYE